MNTPFFLIAGLGATEMLIIIAAIVFMFGGKKIPELMRGIGRGISEFKKGKEGVEQELNKLK